MKKKATIIITNYDNTVKQSVILEKKDTKINYKENADTEVLLDIKNQELIRNNKEIYMELKFKEKLGLINIKELKQNFELSLSVEKFNITNNKIVIKYKIENEDYLYQINMEE